MKRGAAVGVAATIAGAAVVVAIAACGSSGGNNGFGGPYTDGGPHYDGSPFDSSGGDSPFGDGGVNATSATFFWTAQGPASVRLCWAPAGEGFTASPMPLPPSSTPMPASNYAGIPQGGATLMTDATPLTKGNFDLYLLDAIAVATSERSEGMPESCANLACPTNGGAGCVGSDKYTTISSVPALAAGFPYAIAITGAWSAPTAHVVQLASDSSPTPGALNVQTTLLSEALGGATVTFGAAAAGTDGGPDAAFQSTLGFPYTVTPTTPAAITYAGAQSEPGFAAEGFAVDATLGDGGRARTWMSLAQSLSLVAPTEDPHSFYAQRTPFVVAVLGDPAAPAWPGSDAGVYDGTGLHVLVLPTTNTGASP